MKCPLPPSPFPHRVLPMMSWGLRFQTLGHQRSASNHGLSPLRLGADAGSSTAPMEPVRHPWIASPAHRSRSTSHWIWWTGHVEAQLSNGSGPNPACPRAVPWRGRLLRESSRNVLGCGHGHLCSKNPRGTFPTSRQRCAATSQTAAVNPPSTSSSRLPGPLHRSKPQLFHHVTCDSVVHSVIETCMRMSIYVHAGICHLPRLKTIYFILLYVCLHCTGAYLRSWLQRTSAKRVPNAKPSDWVMKGLGLPAADTS